MDIDEALKTARETAEWINTHAWDDETDITILSDKAERLAEAFSALDQWIKKGGFLPDGWNAKR